MVFKPGKSGNPGGRPKAKQFRDALEMELKAAGDDHKALREMARKVIERGRKGDMVAIGFVADRLDGKPAQAIENGEDGDFAIRFSRIERVIVDPTHAEKGEDDASGNDQ